MNLAIVGATGLVGRTMLEVIKEQRINYDTLRLFASSASAGKQISIGEQTLTVEALTAQSFENVDVALFSAGGAISKQYAPIAAAAGCIVIDNSSAWRMDANVPLVVPEVNTADLASHSNIIANPNCSTIQLVVALKPLHDAYTLQRVVVSTYQSVSGAGQTGVDQLKHEVLGTEPPARITSHTLAYNTVFHGIEAAPDDGGAFTEEERKMIRETQRIMHLPDLAVAATCVRVPVLGAHAESVLAEFKQPLPPIEEIRALLAHARGIRVVDDLSNERYPTPQQSEGTDDVAVGRIRRDPSSANGVLFWVVADNLRKGAATNAVQILKALHTLSSTVHT